MKKKNLIILGSTGSVGTQTLDVIRENADKFNVIGLSGNKNTELLKKQIKEFNPEVFYSSSLQGSSASLSKLAQHPKADLIVNALSGKAGVEPTIKAIEAGKNIALANKEVWAYAGEKVKQLLKKSSSKIIPLDSEHNAIFQCLQGEDPANIHKIVLTCSGGPFFGKKKKDLENVTAKDCLNHPTWPDMGKKILVDCATLANKGLEVIEAKYLFNLKPEQIEVVVHRESLVHGYIIFKDGGIKAVISPNDMKIPIAYALFYPERSNKCSENLTIPSLTFRSPDLQTFESLKLAYKAAEQGPKYEQLFVEANDEAVDKFFKGEIKFLDIQESIKSKLNI